MASASRKSRGTLSGLPDPAAAFDFFQLVRLLEASRPECSRVGLSVSPQDEAVRFEQIASTSFPPGDLRRLEARADDQPPTLSVHHFGLLGPHGPLPNVLTDYIVQRIAYRDTTWLQFVNVFNHRLISFYYRSWAMANKAVDYDRASVNKDLADKETIPQGQRFRGYVSCLSGNAKPDTAARDRSLEDALLFLAGRLVFPTANVEGLESMIESFFGIRVRVETFAPRWMPVPVQDKWSCGATGVPGMLGVNTILGGRLLDYQNNIRVVVGPLSWRDFKRLLPPKADGQPRQRSSFHRLCALVKRYTRDQFFWDLQLVLDRKHVPRIRLNGKRSLGRDTWLRVNPHPVDARELIIDPELHPEPPANAT